MEEISLSNSLPLFQVKSDLDDVFAKNNYNYNYKNFFHALDPQGNISDLKLSTIINDCLIPLAPSQTKEINRIFEQYCEIKNAINWGQWSLEQKENWFEGFCKSLQEGGVKLPLIPLRIHAPQQYNYCRLAADHIHRRIFSNPGEFFGDLAENGFNQTAETIQQYFIQMPKKTKHDSYGVLKETVAIHAPVLWEQLVNNKRINPKEKEESDFYSETSETKSVNQNLVCSQATEIFSKLLDSDCAVIFTKGALSRGLGRITYKGKQIYYEYDSHTGTFTYGTDKGAFLNYIVAKHNFTKENDQQEFEYEVLNQDKIPKPQKKEDLEVEEQITEQFEESEEELSFNFEFQKPPSSPQQSQTGGEILVHNGPNWRITLKPGENFKFWENGSLERLVGQPLRRCFADGHTQFLTVAAYPQPELLYRRTPVFDTGEKAHKLVWQYERYDRDKQQWQKTLSTHKPGKNGFLDWPLENLFAVEEKNQELNQQEGEHNRSKSSSSEFDSSSGPTWITDPKEFSKAVNKERVEDDNNELTKIIKSKNGKKGNENEVEIPNTWLTYPPLEQKNEPFKHDEIKPQNNQYPFMEELAKLQDACWCLLPHIYIESCKCLVLGLPAPIYLFPPQTHQEEFYTEWLTAFTEIRNTLFTPSKTLTPQNVNTNRQLLELQIQRADPGFNLVTRELTEKKRLTILLAGGETKEDIEKLLGQASNFTNGLDALLAPLMHTTLPPEMLQTLVNVVPPPQPPPLPNVPSAPPLVTEWQKLIADLKMCDSPPSATIAFERLLRESDSKKVKEYLKSTRFHSNEDNNGKVKTALQTLWDALLGTEDEDRKKLAKLVTPAGEDAPELNSQQVVEARSIISHLLPSHLEKHEHLEKVANALVDAIIEATEIITPPKVRSTLAMAKLFELDILEKLPNQDLYSLKTSPNYTLDELMVTVARKGKQKRPPTAGNHWQGATPQQSAFDRILNESPEDYWQRTIAWNSNKKVEDQRDCFQKTVTTYFQDFNLPEKIKTATDPTKSFTLLPSETLAPLRQKNWELQQSALGDEGNTDLGKSGLHNQMIESQKSTTVYIDPTVFPHAQDVRHSLSRDNPDPQKRSHGRIIAIPDLPILATSDGKTTKRLRDSQYPTVDCLSVTLPNLRLKKDGRPKNERDAQRFLTIDSSGKNPPELNEGAYQEYIERFFLQLLEVAKDQGDHVLVIPGEAFFARTLIQSIDNFCMIIAMATLQKIWTQQKNDGNLGSLTNLMISIPQGLAGHSEAALKSRAQQTKLYEVAAVGLSFELDSKDKKDRYSDNGITISRGDHLAISTELSQQGIKTAIVHSDSDVMPGGNCEKDGKANTKSPGLDEHFTPLVHSINGDENPHLHNPKNWKVFTHQKDHGFVGIPSDYQVQQQVPYLLTTEHHPLKPSDLAPILKSWDIVIRPPVLNNRDDATHEWQMLLTKQDEDEPVTKEEVSYTYLGPDEQPQPWSIIKNQETLQALLQIDTLGFLQGAMQAGVEGLPLFRNVTIPFIGPNGQVNTLCLRFTWQKNNLDLATLQKWLKHPARRNKTPAELQQELASILAKDVNAKPPTLTDEEDDLQKAWRLLFANIEITWVQPNSMPGQKSPFEKTLQNAVLDGFCLPNTPSQFTFQHLQIPPSSDPCDSRDHSSNSVAITAYQIRQFHEEGKTKPMSQEEVTNLLPTLKSDCCEHRDSVSREQQLGDSSLLQTTQQEIDEQIEEEKKNKLKQNIFDFWDEKSSLEGLNPEKYTYEYDDKTRTFTITEKDAKNKKNKVEFNKGTASFGGSDWDFMAPILQKIIDLILSKKNEQNVTGRKLESFVIRFFSTDPEICEKFAAMCEKAGLREEGCQILIGKTDQEVDMPPPVTPNKNNNPPPPPNNPPPPPPQKTF